MTGDKGSDTEVTPAVLKEMQRLGVSRVKADHYVYRAYRYATLAAALAQARLETQTDG